MADVGDSPPQRFSFVYSCQVGALFYNNLAKTGCLSKKNGLMEETP